MNGEEARRREFAATVYVLNEARDRMLFVQRRKPPFVGSYLPPGGHLEPEETPDEAAVREVREETGYDVELLGDPEDAPSEPGVQPLKSPLLIQLERIDEAHDHVDLIYAGIARGEPQKPEDGEAGGVWLSASEIRTERMPDNVRRTALRLLSEHRK